MAQKIIDIDASKPIESTVAELELPRRPLIVLLGDFDSRLDDQIRGICSRVLVPAALNPGALILDNARCEGCAALIAKAALDQDKPVALLGIVSSDTVASDIDGHHEMVLRLPSAWADTTKYTFQIADELVNDGTVPKPALAVLFGGAEAEKRALVRCARRGWPVLVVKGSGRLADQILEARSTSGNGAAAPETDPDLREIVETASIYPASIDASVDELNRILFGRIDERPEMFVNTLKEAWRRFDELDATAISKQRTFRVLETALITLTVLAALFAILTSGANAVSPWWRWWFHAHGLRTGDLHLLVLSTPISISIIAAYMSHFRDGNKWILLRGAAETLKSEIFRFRAKAGAYSDEQCLQTSRDLKLAARIKDISSALEQSEVNKIRLRAVAPPKPQERASFLLPDGYIQARLRDQAEHFEDKTCKLSRKLIAMQLLIYVAGAAGTFLAAIQLDIWVALATALVTGFTTKLQADQVENSLMQSNQALASLRNLDAWWMALSPWEKGRRNNIDLLVDQTETALEAEMAGWVRQMQSALDKLTEKEPQK